MSIGADEHSDRRRAEHPVALDVPADWETLGNGAEATGAVTSGRKHVTFAETQPISTYLFAFAAGKFSVDFERFTRYSGMGGEAKTAWTNSGGGLYRCPTT